MLMAKSLSSRMVTKTSGKEGMDISKNDFPLISVSDTLVLALRVSGLGSYWILLSIYCSLLDPSE